MRRLRLPEKIRFDTYLRAFKKYVSLPLEVRRHTHFYARAEQSIARFRQLVRLVRDAQTAAERRGEILIHD
jgi:hypothetical protein